MTSKLEPRINVFRIHSAVLLLSVLYFSCTGESKKQSSIPSDCDCKDIASRILMNQQSVDDFEKMKTCIEQGKMKNNKVSHGNAVGDMAEAFAGFSELCDNVSENKSETNNETENSTQLNSVDNDNKRIFEDISGDYSGESVMGNDVGVGQISINSSGRATLYYNHGNLGSAKEYGNLTPSQGSQSSNEMYFKFKKDAGGEYNVRIVKSPSQMTVILTGTNWRVTTSRSIKSNSSDDTTSQAAIADISSPSINDQPENNSQSKDQIQDSNVISVEKFQSGNYLTNGSGNHKVHFYNTPNYSIKRNAYFDSHEEVFVQKIINGFGYVEFTNTRGEKSIGWLDMHDLIFKP